MVTEKCTKTHEKARTDVRASFLFCLGLFERSRAYSLFAMASRNSLLFSALTVTPSSLNMPARSLVISPLSMVSMVAFSSLSAKSDSSLLPSSSPRFLSAPVHANSVATELVEVSSPF